MRDRNAEVRAKLRPLEPGEWPLGLRLAIALAALLALANLVVLVATTGAHRREGLIFALVLAFLAVGMAQRQYWAVLAFEVLLGISTIYAALSLMFVSNLTAALLALAVIAVCAPVFWLLVRVMARMQTPRPEPGP